MRKLFIIFIYCICSATYVQAQDSTNYQATRFGIVSDGIADNTMAIQQAIDYIAEKGGGKLSFYVGRYLTGGLELKSNVTIELNEGAILVASPNVNDYPIINGKRSFLSGNNLTNVKIIGKGVIEANASSYYELLDLLKGRKVLDANYLNPIPSLIGFNNSKNIEISGIILQKSLKSLLVISNCSNVALEDLIIRNNNVAGSDAITLSNSTNVSLQNLFVDCNGKALVKDKSSKITKTSRAITPNGKSIL